MELLQTAIKNAINKYMKYI